MARRLAPKFSKKNVVSEKLTSIRKNYFASEKKLIFFLQYIATYRAVEVRILVIWCALIFVLTD